MTFASRLRSRHFRFSIFCFTLFHPLPVLKSLLYRSTLLLDQALGHLPSFGAFRPIKGSFSAFEHLRQRKLNGRILWESQKPGPCPPGSITQQSGLNQHDYQPWPAFWVRSDEARLVGSMLHWRDKNELICSEGVFHMRQRRRLSEDRYLAQILVSKPHYLPGAWTSLASNWSDGKNYFHWMLDGLTRLQVREHLPEETRILLPAKRPSYISETIEMLGLSELAQPAANSCVKPERFYFCSPISMTGVWNPLGFDWLRNKFSPFFHSKPDGNPIFLTRRGSTRMPEDLDLIENTFSKHGFEIVDCGLLSVRDQILKASAAPAIAGFHGAAMTNLLWAKTGTAVLELFQPAYINACYEQIALQGELQYAHLILKEGTPHESLLTWLRKQ